MSERRLRGRQVAEIDDRALHVAKGMRGAAAGILDLACDHLPWFVMVIFGIAAGAADMARVRCIQPTPVRERLRWPRK
jgi:hypothetical protein